MKAPRITLDQWKILQAVIDHGGYAQAAQALHCSQSSVSYNIARMQEQLAMPLLRIEGRKAVLTATGEILLRRSRQLTADASQWEALAQHIQEGWEAEVRLVVDVAYPSQKIVQALQAFKPLSHGCRVLLREEVLSGAEELLCDGVADIAISGVDIAGYLPIELGTITFIAVAHQQHPLHQPEPYYIPRRSRSDSHQIHSWHRSPATTSAYPPTDLPSTCSVHKLCPAVQYRSALFPECQQSYMIPPILFFSIYATAVYQHLC